MKKQVLVTGADGFIGSHVVEVLVNAGCNVKAFVQYNSFGSWGWLDNVRPATMRSVEVMAGDIRDPDCVDSAVSGCTSVLHLAALIAIPFSYLAPESYIQTNVLGTLNVLQASRRHSVEHVVCTSTSATYGSAQFVPITESHPANAQSPYAASKVAADQLALSFYYSFDLPVTVLRPFNTYGPRQSARAVIPTIISQISNGSREIRLGSTYPTRDFTFVTDTARAFLDVLNSRTTIGMELNLGTGFEISIKDLTYLIAQAMEVEVEIVSDSDRTRPEASEVDRLIASSEKFHNLVGWSAIHKGRDGLTNGLLKTIKWFTDPDNAARYKSQIYNI